MKNPSAMTMAAVGMARVTGNIIIDRREVGEAGAFSEKTDEELMQIAADRAARLGLGPKLVVDNGPGNVANIDSDLANKDPEAG